MAFDVSAISQWNNEVADRSQIIMQPLLGGKTFPLLEQYAGITGENVKFPKFETTTPWQTGSGCGFTSSGTTTVSQFTMTTAPITINEAICLNDLESKFTKSWLPKGTSSYTDLDIVNLWVERKLMNLSKQIESALWQAKTTYTNATHLKAFNGLISTIDTAGDAVTATATAAITSANVISIFDEIIFQKLASIPQILQENPVVYCSMEDYLLLVQALKTANLFHYSMNNGEMKNMELVYPGTNIKVIALPGLNSTNSVDSGSLATAVKHRIIATFPSNLAVAYNANNDTEAAKLWFSDDNDQMRLKLRFHLGVGVKYTNLCVTYANS
jgi:hypothetical protein